MTSTLFYTMTYILIKNIPKTSISTPCGLSECFKSASSIWSVDPWSAWPTNLYYGYINVTIILLCETGLYEKLTFLNQVGYFLVTIFSLWGGKV
ncbi:hypothetical protein GDO78_001932 [Eleutherodactylus coqui]|uniref:Uncharacterized protein n=1 Tax=Eleutherodactylus coqui TaxID=57060 RepID=A0A8J6FWV9_ELECQ|nr:hypothetical protein GDO78_001932 [Eleutherodactylus coqui]